MVKLQLQHAEAVELEALAVTDAKLARAHLDDRVRHFARVRAAHRALTPSSPHPAGEVDPEIAGAIRDCLNELKSLVDVPDDEVLVPRAKLLELDVRLDAYQKALMAWVTRLPLAQLRASLGNDTHAERLEASALLQICLESEAVPNRLLPIVDFLITLLSAGQRDDAWVMDFDPVDLNDVIRARCASRHLERSAELRIIRRFQRAVDELANASDASELFREISAYKCQVAGFYFVPSILRCIVGYNVAARNHVRSRVRRGREFDAALDVDLGSVAPLQGDDPCATQLRSR